MCILGGRRVRYYRGTRAGEPFRFGSYFTKDLSEAAFYAGKYNGRIIAAEIEPRRPYVCEDMCTIPELARRFGVKYRGAPGEEKKVYERIREAGYDSVLKDRQGEWIVVLDPSIVRRVEPLRCDEAERWLGSWLNECLSLPGDQEPCFDAERLLRRRVMSLCT